MKLLPKPYGEAPSVNPGTTIGFVRFVGEEPRQPIIVIEMGHQQADPEDGQTVTYNGTITLRGDLATNLLTAASRYSKLLVSPSVLYVSNANQDIVREAAAAASEMLEKTLGGLQGDEIVVEF